MVGVRCWSGKPPGAAELVPQTIDLLILVDGGLLEGADVVDGWWEDGWTDGKQEGTRSEVRKTGDLTSTPGQPDGTRTQTPRRTFTEDLPLARLRASLSRQLVPELVKEVLHLAPPLSFGQFVAHAELWAPRVGRARLRVGGRGRKRGRTHGVHAVWSAGPGEGGRLGQDAWTVGRASRGLKRRRGRASAAQS